MKKCNHGHINILVPVDVCVFKLKIINLFSAGKRKPLLVPLPSASAWKNGIFIFSFCAIKQSSRFPAKTKQK